jgi:hypothetical protein
MQVCSADGTGRYAQQDIGRCLDARVLDRFDSYLAQAANYNRSHALTSLQDLRSVVFIKLLPR